MTEGERAFYKWRIRQEMRLAGVVKSRELKELHLAWAQFFEDRLNGNRKSLPPPAPQHYCHKMEDFYSAKINDDFPRGH
jgi:hypothetical protein